MIEKHIVLEDIDLVTFYGVQNVHLQMIKALYPKLRIVARKNPKAYYDAQMYAYNIPEFIDDKVRTRGSDIASFARKDSGIQLSFRRR